MVLLWPFAMLFNIMMPQSVSYRMAKFPLVLLIMIPVVDEVHMQITEVIEIWPG